jgi:hypothetical protein
MKGDIAILRIEPKRLKRKVIELQKTIYDLTVKLNEQQK